MISKEARSVSVTEGTLINTKYPIQHRRARSHPPSEPAFTLSFLKAARSCITVSCKKPFDQPGRS